MPEAWSLACRDVARLALRAEDRQRLIQGVCDRLVTPGPLALCAIGIGQGKVLEVACAGDPARRACARAPRSEGVGPSCVGPALGRGAPDASCPGCPLAAPGADAVVVPIPHGATGGSVAILVATARPGLAAGPEALALLQEVAADVGAGLATLKARGRSALAEARLREAQALAHVGSWELDLARNRLWWSDEIFHIFEIDPGEFGASYEAFLSAVHPDDRRLVDETYTRSVRERTPYEIVHRLVLKDGRVKYVHERGETYYDGEGRALRSVGTAQDVTERRRAEAELVAERGRLRTLVDTIPDLVWLKDPDGVYLACNLRFERLYGAREAEIVGKTDYDFVDRELADFFREHDRKAVAAGRPSINEEWLTFKDDGYRGLYETIKTPMRGADGRLIGVLGIARDVTAARRAQEKLEQAGDDLRKLSRAVEQSPVSVVITDTSGTIEYVNPRFCELTGYSRAEAVGKNPRILKSGSTPPAVYEDLWSTVTSGQEWKGELENRKRGGETYVEHLVISPVRDARGAVTHFVAMAEDVTERRRADETLRAVREQLLHSQKMEAVGRLAGGIAHDFNNLLTVIDGYAHLVLDGLPEGDRLRPKIEQVIRATDRATGLTRQLLAFSRKLPSNPRVLDLVATLRGMENMLHRLIGEGLSLQIVTAPDAGKVVADPGQIEQVVMNLVVNARDATPTGGVIRVELANAELDEAAAASLRPGVQPGPHVRLSVSDTGAGMDERVQARLFEPFFTTKPPGKGTGLGLATVYGIVRQCGGALRVESAPSRGTRFSVFLPRTGERGAASSGSRGDRRSLARGTETILLAEDESAVRELVSEVLQAAGYHVLVGGLPFDALALADSYGGPIDLLLSDVIMPQLDGPALAERLRRIRPGIRVLFTSGYPGETLPEAARGRCLAKPFTSGDLARAVRAALDEPPAPPPPG